MFNHYRYRYSYQTAKTWMKYRHFLHIHFCNILQCCTIINLLFLLKSIINKEYDERIRVDFRSSSLFLMLNTTTICRIFWSFNYCGLGLVFSNGQPVLWSRRNLGSAPAPTQATGSGSRYKKLFIQIQIKKYSFEK